MLDVKDGDFIHYKFVRYNIKTNRIIETWEKVFMCGSRTERMKDKITLKLPEKVHVVKGIKYVLRTIVCSECYKRKSVKLPISNNKNFKCEGCHDQ